MIEGSEHSGGAGAGPVPAVAPGLAAGCRAPGRRPPAAGRLRAVALGLTAALAVGAAACGGQGAPQARGAGSPPGDRVPSTTPVDTGARQAAGADTVGPQGQRITHLDVGGHDVTAEIAETADERARGLMYRDSLPPDHGMLFVYPQAQTLGFWMRNTKIPLDIAFIDPQGRIVDIQHMEAESDTTHTSAQPAMYALEMASGWFGGHGVKVGDRVAF